jgi:hypothetical protein
MATIRNAAISLLRLTGWTNIAAGLRHHSRDPARAITYLLTCQYMTFPGPWSSHDLRITGTVESGVHPSGSDLNPARRPVPSPVSGQHRG